MRDGFWAQAIRFIYLLAALCILPAAAFALSKGELPVPQETQALMLAKDMTLQAPILMRSYKKEGEIEIWKLNRSGRYVFLKTYPVCRWSGTLGPKKSQGDRQTPEGFYAVGPAQMNPNSHYYLSFDTGYPNAYDRAHGATGFAVMVHGTCSSAGCFAMTDQQIGEIFAIARDALRGGQAAFQFQAYPFRMTAANMAKYRLDPNIGFWGQLKEGSDRFEATGEELSVSVINGRYVFAPSQDSAKEILAQAQHKREEAKLAALIAQGSEAILTTYADGGQNPYFAALLKKGAKLGEVSRPEALALAGLDLVISPAKGACARREGCPGLALKSPAAPPLKAAGMMPKFILASIRVARNERVETDPAVIAPKPYCYKLGRPAPAQSIIAGGMPVLPAVLLE